MSPEVLEKAELQQLLNELFNFVDDNFVRSGDRMQAFQLGRPTPKVISLTECTFLVPVLLVVDLSLIVLQIGDVDRCTVYISLAPGMENPTGVDPPEDDAAQCLQYTSSEEEQDHPALTTEDRVAGKRPLVADPSPAETLPAKSSQAPKRRRLVRIADDDDEEEEEAAPSLVRRPRSHPDVAPATAGQMTSDPPAPHVEPARVVETVAQALTSRSRRRFFTATHRRSDLFLILRLNCDIFCVLLLLLTLIKCRLVVSTASDVDPDRVAGQKVAETVAVVGDAAPQTTEQPATTTVAESAEEHPAPARATASTPTRTPPPSNVVEEESRAPTPPPNEERGVPILPRAGASSPVGSPGLDQGPVMPATIVGGIAANEETRTASDDEVEEIQGRPRDGRQHVYVWRQRGDHFIGHEELTETEEAVRVERAAKRLVDEVKVSGPLCCSTLMCNVPGFSMYSSYRAQ